MGNTAVLNYLGEPQENNNHLKQVEIGDIIVQNLILIVRVHLIIKVKKNRKTKRKTE